MTGAQLATADPNLVLVPIDIERDARHGVEWLMGNNGRDTLRKMGVPDEYNHESTLRAERERLQKILDNPNELAWMIQLHDTVIGITEVHTDEFEGLAGPNIHIMIGDVTARGKGVGTAVLERVIDYLRSEKHFETIYSRHLTDNTASASLLAGLGFIDQGEAYRDNDGLEWQNVIKEN